MSSLADELSAQIRELIVAAIARGEINAIAPDSITLDRPKNRDHGDYATSVALQLAKSAGKQPREVAEILQSAISQLAGVASVDIAGPGFINITLNRANQAELVRTILTAGSAYGRSSSLNGVSVNLEFISANPTGPIHLGHTRWAAVGDALGRVLSAAGAKVSREFYINDRGNQMNLFGQSVQAAALGQPIPEDGYHGEYIKDLATTVLANNPGISTSEEFREAAYRLQLVEQQGVLETFHTHFDTW
jgi:arginyl-tRNA synthetase